MSKSMEAYKQAMKDIRAELRKEGKAFIAVSCKQLLSLTSENITMQDVYCSCNDVYLRGVNL